MSHDCPYCGMVVADYHHCDAGSDRVAFECSDCGDTIGRDTNQMDISGVAPARCVQCVFARMGEPR